ncbi:MAG: IclR family transcriptional regulator [Pseudomonadota bacterium]
MSASAKTLKLLGYFTTARPEIGLSDLCRLAGRDKATTYRYLQALEEVGFVEQNPISKQYRLGPAILQLAEVREATVPRKAAATPTLQGLADATGETAHVAVLSGTNVYSLMSIESPKHSTRAVIDITRFPLHATASGLCAIAFGPKTVMAAAEKNLKQFTSETPISPETLMACVAQTRETGFGASLGTFEIDVFSVSAPIFDHTGCFAGSVSVASVATRFDATLERLVKSELIKASQDITRDWGGTVPQDIAQRLQASLLTSNIRETAQ